MMAGMRSPQGGFMAEGASQESPGAKKGMTSSQRAIPCVTIRQIMSAQSEGGADTFKFHGMDLAHCCFIGVVRNIAENSLNLTFDVEDGTGLVAVRIWIDGVNDQAATIRATCQEGTYVRVIGQIRVFKDTRSFQAFSMVPIEDFNEITHHMLEAIHAHVASTRPKADAGFGARGGSMMPTGSVSNNFYQRDAAPAVGGDGLSALQRQILGIISRDSQPSSHGISIEAISREVPRVPFSELETVLNFLSSEGHIFSTIDDNHYKSTTA